MAGGSGFVVTPQAAEPAKGGTPAATGGLSITTDPDNAAVYLDGRPVGQTPAHLMSIAAGEHRVRVVKNGYLENARVVTVQAGAPTVVSVKLTRSNNSTLEPAGQVSSTSTSSSGGSKKWLWIAIAGGGAAAAAAAVILTKNDPPVPGTISVSPSATGMAGQTSYTISSNATDPDKDPLTYAWNFGDGGSGTGQSVTHTFQGAGTFQVQLAVSDGKHTVNAPNASVVVGPPISGTWTGGSDSFFGCGMNFTISSQNGTALTGTQSLSGSCSGNITLASASATSPLTHPNAITWVTQSFTFTTGNSNPCPSSLGGCPNLTWRFTGTTDSGGTSVSGTLTLAQSSSSFTNSNSTSFRRSQ